MYTKAAILAALLSRSKTGKGQHIDVSLLECQVASLVNLGSSYLNSGNEATRWGTAHANIVPYRAYETRDGTVVMGAGNDVQFQKLVKLLELEDLVENEEGRFESNEMRVKNREELDSIIENVVKRQTNEYWEERFEDSGLPFAPLNNLEQTFKHPQLQTRNMICTAQHPTVGSIKLIGPPVKYSEYELEVRLPPPTLGQHTNEVLRELGYGEECIEEFRRKGVI